MSAKQSSRLRGKLHQPGPANMENYVMRFMLKLQKKTELEELQQEIQQTEELPT